MKLYLIATIPNGYALREFQGIAYCLNKSNKDFCVVIDPNNVKKNSIEISEENFYIVSDYYFNPTFDIKKVPKYLINTIKNLPKSSTAIYYSDPLFKFDDPSKFDNWDYFVFFGLSNYRKTKTIEYKDCRIWENIDISTKSIVDIPISELAFWSYIKMNNGNCDFTETRHDYDISYIINSKVKSRLRLLSYLDGISSQLGNFPSIDNNDIQLFVKRNPECQYETLKVFGLDYLYHQNGKFTLVIDDDKPIKVAWPMRFYECMSVGIIPMLDEKKDCYFIYKNYNYLSMLEVRSPVSLRESIRFSKNPKEYNKLLNDAKRFMKDNVYNYSKLYNKTIKAIEGRECLKTY